MTNGAAVNCYDAVREQSLLIISHIERLKINLNRYQAGTWEYIIKMLELQKWIDTLTLLQALYEGKTVPPS